MFEDGEEGEGGGTEVEETPEVPDTDTDTDTDTVPETPETPETPAVDVLGTFADQEWAKALIEDQGERGEYPVTQEDIDALPIEAKRILAALAHRGKTAGGQLDQLKTDAQAQLDAATAREERALLAQAEALKWAGSSKIGEFMAKVAPTGEQPDPSSPEGIEWLAKKHVSELLAEFIKTVEEERGAVDTRHQAAVEQRERETKIAEVQTFINQHPEDFDKAGPVYPKILALLKRTNHTITVQEAHRLVVRDLQVDELERVHSAELKASRDRVVRSGNRGRVVPELPKEYRGDTELEDAWYEKNPEARARDIDRRLRGL